MKQQYIYGIHTVMAALADSSVQEILLQQSRHDKRLQDILALANKNNVVVKYMTKKELDKLIADGIHQGVVAIIRNNKVYNEENLIDIVKSSAAPLLLILDGVQDPHNLGACLRSANAAGVDAVITPKDNAVGLTPAVCKVASGAAQNTPFIQVTNLARTLRMLKEHGVWLYGAVAGADTDFFSADLSGAAALVLGAEGKGLRRLTKEHCDVLISIPMLGAMASLNVSVAAGICLFEAVRQRKRKGKVDD